MFLLDQVLIQYCSVTEPVSKLFILLQGMLSAGCSVFALISHFERGDVMLLFTFMSRTISRDQKKIAIEFS